MKNKILNRFFLVIFFSIFLSCDEDNEVIIDRSRRDVTIAEFLETNANSVTFLNAARESAIPFELAERYQLTPLAVDPDNGLAVREFGENGLPNTYHSVLDLLDVENADFTVFVPRLDLQAGGGSTLDITDINRGFLSNEELAQQRAEIGNVLLYHILDRRVRIEDLNSSEVPLSSGGNDEFFVRNEFDETINDNILRIGGVELGSTTNVESGNLVNGIFHNLANFVLEVTAATPVPVLINTNVVQLNEEGNIEVLYTRELSAESVANTPLDSYALSLDGAPVAITEARLDDEDPSIIVLTPATAFSNNFGNLTLSYTGNTVESELAATSELEGFVEAFSELPVLASVDRIFSLRTNFESENDFTGAGAIYRSRERQAGQSFEQAFTGLFSFRFANFADGTDLSEAVSAVTPVNYRPGRVRTLADFAPNTPVTDATATYRLEFALFIEDLPVVDAADPVEFEFRVQGQPGGILAMPRFDVVSNPPTLTINPDPLDITIEETTPLVKGSWQIVKIDIPGTSFVLSSTDDLYRFVFASFESNNPNPFLFYLDDIRMYQLD